MNRTVILSILWVLRIIGIVLVALALIFLVAFIFQFVPGASQYPVIHKIYSYTLPSIAYVANLIPTRFKGSDFGALVIVVVLLVVKGVIDRVKEVLVERLSALSSERSTRQFPTEGEESITPLQHPSAVPEDQHGRKSLLKQWIDIKEKLEKSQRLLAFLSVDIIGSTLMKEGEDPHFIEYTFTEYKQFIDEILKLNNVWKVTWTPDGLMSAFLTMEEAVKAGKEIIIGLDAFNKYVNRLKTPIRVRCGINYGRVVFDIDARMEDVTHRVIDIAGHLQKSAEPDSIWIAKEIFEYLNKKEKGEGYQQVQVKVDDTEVVEWKKT